MRSITPDEINPIHTVIEGKAIIVGMPFQSCSKSLAIINTSIIPAIAQAMINNNIINTVITIFVFIA